MNSDGFVAHFRATSEASSARRQLEEGESRDKNGPARSERERERLSAEMTVSRLRSVRRHAFQARHFKRIVREEQIY